MRGLSHFFFLMKKSIFVTEINLPLKDRRGERIEFERKKKRKKKEKVTERSRERERERERGAQKLQEKKKKKKKEEEERCLQHQRSLRAEVSRGLARGGASCARGRVRLWPRFSQALLTQASPRQRRGKHSWRCVRAWQPLPLLLLDFLCCLVSFSFSSNFLS